MVRMEKGLCGTKDIGCQGTKPLRKTCMKCSLYDASMETDYYPKTLKEARNNP